MQTKVKAKTNGKSPKVKAAEILPPHNMEAEESVLGSLLIDQDAIIKIPFLEVRDFFMERHRWVFAAIKDLHREHAPIDIVTLSEELEKRGQLIEIGGPPYLTDLSIATPTSMHVEWYANIVREKAIKRAQIDLGRDLTESAFSDDTEPESTSALAKGRLAEIDKRLAADGNTFNLAQSLDYHLDILEKREREQDKEKIQFPWDDFNRLTPYLDAGTLVGIIADPGVGKTAFLENCAESWAKRGRKVAFFHFELSSQMMMDRRMQRATGVPIKRLQDGGRRLGADWPLIIDAVSSISAWPGNIHYVHCPGWTIGQVASHAQKIHDSDGLDIVIVDYLNKIRTVDRNGLNSALSREADIEDFKVSLEVNGWVGLMAAQFDKSSRSGTWRTVRTLADAKETSGLEDKSNVGIVLRRDRDNDGKRESLTMAHVVKCNAGQEGAVTLYFKGQKLLFTPLETKGIGF